MEMTCPQPLPVFRKLYSRSIWKTESTNEIILSFDDGPGEMTESILNWAREYEAKFVFFILPAQIREFGDLVSEIDRQGHLIGSHFLDHNPYWLKGKSKFQSDLKKSTSIIEDTIGKEVIYCRAPYGRIRPGQEAWIEELGLKHVFWSVNSCDYSNKSLQVINSKLTGKMNPGSIFLLHDGNAFHQGIIHILDFINDNVDTGIKFNFKSLLIG